jgi:hypothetical protein
MPFREIETTQLSKEQIDILELPTKGRVIISGPPGSGKTILALLRLNKIDHELESDSTGLVMYNRMVRMETIQAARHLKLRNASSRPTGYAEWMASALSHMFGEKITRDQLFEPGAKAIGKPNWSLIKKMLNQRTLIEDSKRWVVVDEGQDFPREFYEFLYEYWPNVTIFADDNQSIGSDGSTIQSISQHLARPVHMTVSTNFRNTKETAAFAEHLNTKGIGGSPGKTPESTPRGNKPEMFQVETDRDLAASFCRRAIADLLDRNQQPDHALLTATETNRRKMFDLVNEEWLKAVDARKPTAEERGRMAALVELIQEYVPERLKRPKIGSPGVFIMTMNAAKGCEFESVTLNTKGVNERWSGLDQKKMLYVACTRARGDLRIGIISTNAEIQLQTPEALRSIPDTVLTRSWLTAKVQKDFAEQLPDGLGLPAVNDRVRHKLFGLGIVTNVITGKPITLEVNFGIKGNRTVTAQSVEVVPHDV